MAKFLNSSELRKWIPRVIDEAERELVIIVPFIKTSKLLYQSLFNANNRSVETTIVYRENTLPKAERTKLKALDNLNLLYHPNVHAKCYLNEKYLVVTSMNMYEFSEKNNREMGVLLMGDIGNVELDLNRTTDEEAIEEAILEMNTIINSATMEKKSRETIEEGFEMEIIKTKWEKEEAFCRKLNKVFENKRFKVENLHNKPISKCSNYYDKIDVYIEYRVELVLDMGEDVIKEIFKRIKPHYNEFQFKYFKYYWNHPKQSIYLYRDNSYDEWSKEEKDTLILLRKGIDNLIKHLRKYF